MDGRTPVRTACCFALLLALSGCDQPLVPAEDAEGPLADVGRRFDPASTGTVEGRVIWEGPRPVVPPFRAPVSPLSEQAGGKKRSWHNPHTPAIAPDGSLAGAVIFLRGVDPDCSRPWDLPPVRIVLRDYLIHVWQGNTVSRCGFVRQGDTIEISSAQPVFHSIRARGAAFFSLTFPLRSQPCRRRLDRAGVVKLTSGAGYFWMRGHLFVTNHPYYTHTDSAGRFVLPQVPSGTYEVVCWLPDWRPAGQELDADTGLTTRLTFRPPLQLIQTVTVRPGQRALLPFRVSGESFGR